MYRAIVFKEWLKIRWTYLAVSVVFAGVLVNLALQLNYAVKFDGAMNVWYSTIFRHWRFYSLLQYVPLFAGAAVAIAQFVPEVLQSRMKLTFHLPVRENGVLLSMLSVGFLAVGILFVVALVALSFVTLLHFPIEVLKSVLLTSVPWFLAGFAAYVILAAVVAEPRWVRRAILLLLGYGMLDAFVLEGSYNAYAHSLQWFVLLTGCWSIAVLLSGHRFRRGVR